MDGKGKGWGTSLLDNCGRGQLEGVPQACIICPAYKKISELDQLRRRKARTASM